MKYFHSLFKKLAALILQACIRLLQYIFIPLCGILLCLASIHSAALADENATVANKISAEEAFLEGQRYLEQANLPFAELSLTRIASNSPYAKLLAGNIAANNGEYDRAFLLLLPLQSNQTLIKTAVASLHASLSNAYEKQGDIINALDQLMRKETFLQDLLSINTNHERIWQLLSSMPVQELIAIRGESTDTNSQGWIDLSLATKNPEHGSSINIWANSYPDHVASEFSKKLLAQLNTQKENGSLKLLNKLPSNGQVALILPLDNGSHSANTDAFIQGLQAALNKHAMLNAIKVYPSQSTQESIAQQYTVAKNEGAEYVLAPEFITPKLAETQIYTAIDTVDEANTPTRMAIQINLPIDDEAKAIAAFASSNAIQHITIITTDDDAASHLLTRFQGAWEDVSNNAAITITLAHNIKPGDADLLDLKAQIASQTHDMVVLATSAQNVRTIRPYLNISTPVFAFSNINEIVNNDQSNASLNAVRFTDIPFLIHRDDAKFAYYQSQSADINSNQLLRNFALGVDYMELLIIRASAATNEMAINGLTGQLHIDKNGNIQRQLSIARFSDNGIVLEK